MEVVLPRRVVPQPMPFIKDGGDCGACVLAGLLELTVPAIYERHKGVSSINRPEVSDILWRAKSEGLVDHFVDRVPYWRCLPPYLQPFGDTAWAASLEWFDYVSIAMQAGYYAVAFVAYNKSGPLGDGADHVVLLCGARRREESLSAGAKLIKSEILVSCSARSSPDEEWVDVRQFLRDRGGYNVVLVRPA